MDRPVSLHDIIVALRKIENLCTTQHWTSDRRWAIELRGSEDASAAGKGVR